MVVQKLNQIDEKVDNLSRKVNMLFCKSGQASNDELPTVPQGLILPADTVKDLSACGMAVREERVRRKLVRDWVFCYFLLVSNCLLLLFF